MKVGIMQPYFFPYLGYFSLIKEVDLFILLDEVQFIRHGWIERNRILKPEEGWQYIKCPLKKHSRDTLIKDIEIRNADAWQNKILSQLTHYKKNAAYYEKTLELLITIFKTDSTHISGFNQNSLEIICKYLRINTKIVNFRDLNLTIKSPKAPDEWALNICKALGNVNEYINPIGGEIFFDKNKYEINNIELKFLKYSILNYKQKNSDFEPGLSIIDVMLFNDEEQIQKHLNSYELL